MSRYAAMFDRLAAQREGALGIFLMLGDPELATSARLLDEVVEAGADMIEVGIPFSDPVADGPVVLISDIYMNLCKVHIHTEFEGVLRPQPVSQFLSGYDLATAIQQERQELKGLVLQVN